MLTRRNFIKLCMSATLAASLSESILPVLRQAQAEKQAEKPPVIWLELGSCTGNSISLQNAVDPGLDEFLSQAIDLKYHWLLNTVQGQDAVDILLDTVHKEAGRFWLVIEGAVMTAANGRVNYVFSNQDKMVTGLQAIEEFAAKAKYVLAVGSCAAFGGPSAAYPNPGGAVGVEKVVRDKPVINIPGCPANSDWITGTMSHLMLYGIPELDSLHRPKLFYGRTIHQLCQRRQLFEDGIFASFPGEAGCLYKVGCKGPTTYADCPLRQWNNHISWPVKAGAPCIGCTSPKFPDSSMPFYEHFPDISTPSTRVSVKKISAAFVALGVGVVGTHLAAGVFSRRIHQHFLDGTKPSDPTPPENLAEVKQELDDLIRRQNALLSETKQLETVAAKEKKSWARRVADFWRTEDKDGK
ncbi:MAG: hydA: hydrogenase (NiFe) small subunit (hydA) [Firmicutes bacterium]|nr:hydA: hydrogenase (NiFe) small subunit (hydA) [Bacillota bacterium]